ncbi:MAG: hypothetical protein ACOYEI_00610 [Acetivibrionales bacterium]|jgi:uncharacterized membrane protein
MANQKNMYLKVTGILMIIGAVLGLIGVITLLAGMSLLMGAAGVETGTELLLIALIPALLVVIFQLVTGIMGIKNSDKPEKAKVCIVLGAITLALALINTIIAITSPDMNVNVVSTATGLLIPIFYLAGAFQNKKLYDEISRDAA